MTDEKITINLPGNAVDLDGEDAAGNPMAEKKLSDGSTVRLTYVVKNADPNLGPGWSLRQYGADGEELMGFEALDKSMFENTLASFLPAMIPELAPAPAGNAQEDDETEKCPACGGAIDLDDLNVNDNQPDGYGDMSVPYTCPHCGRSLKAVFQDGGDYNFKYFELD